MPIRKSRLIGEEQQEFRARVLRLKRAGIVTGTSGKPSSVPKRFILRQIDRELARIHDLPSGEVAAVMLCELMALKPGATIRHCAMTPPWGGPQLDLSEPQESPWYDGLIQGLPHSPPTVLNRWLTGQAPLPRGPKLEGVVIATGQNSAPPNYHNEMQVVMELSLTDEKGNKLEFEFKARVDRSLKRKYERQQRYDAPQLKKRDGLYGGQKSELGGRKQVPPKEPNVSRGRGALPITDDADSAEAK